MTERRREPRPELSRHCCEASRMRRMSRRDLFKVGRRRRRCAEPGGDPRRVRRDAHGRRRGPEPPSDGRRRDGARRRQLNFANWPLYIDKAKDENGERYHPSLRQFTDADRHRRQLPAR